MNKPLLSIVIANYNYGHFLEDAIKSVINQNMGDKVELIICDAASTDNSVEIIKKYANGLPSNTTYFDWIGTDTTLPTDSQAQVSRITWWCSEKDGGQSAAFNKGFSHARGEILTWLNSDDILLPGSVNAVIRAFKSCPKADWATGNFVRFTDKDKKIIEANWGPHWVPFLLQGNGFPLSIFGPTVFWKKKAYDRIGPIDEKLHYTMDSDYWRRLTVAGSKFVRVNIDCWAFRMHEESKTAEFNNHSRTKAIKLEMQHETEYSVSNTGYSVSRWRSLLKVLMRLLDGSYVKKLWRRTFLLGRDINNVYYGKDKKGVV